MRIKKRIFVSVSAGRSSAVAAFMIWQKYKNDPNVEIVFGFANTSREVKKTLIFCHKLTEFWGIPIVWIEAVVHEGRKSCTHKVVSFETAKTDGSVFEAVINKYGIPNQFFKHCTRELKTNPIRSYLKSIGWGTYLEYTTVIGFRADEIKKRINKNYQQGDDLSDYSHKESLSQWYPLVEWGIYKPDVAMFWKRQPFDLGIPDYEGNCKDCFEKTDTKIITQHVISPGDTWIARMESKYGYYVGGRDVTKFAPPYRFFRGNRTIAEVMEGLVPGFRLAEDKSMLTEGATLYLDEEYESCGGGECHPFGEEDVYADL